MEDQDLTVVEMIHNPRILLCEASEMRGDGHYYLYRYNGQEGNFYRATVPSGAGNIHFELLTANDKIPLGGWRMVERSEIPARYLRLVTE